MRYYNFITDFTEKEVTGGAELCDADLRVALEAKGWMANIIQPKQDWIQRWDVNLPTIVSNRSLFDYRILCELLEGTTYTVIEHDYQILRGRNPYRDIETNPVEFYENAGLVIFQSEFQQKLFMGIVEANFLPTYIKAKNFGNPFFSPKYLRSLKIQDDSIPYNRMEKALILNSTNAIKGTQQALQLVPQLHLEYTLFPNEPRPYIFGEFSMELMKHKYFLFVPQYPESYSRVLLEAAVNGCELITPANTGFYHQFESLGFDRSKLLPTITENCEKMVNEIVCELQQS